MFSDLFESRGDYLKGKFYQLNRQYLVSGNSLEPPLEFKTREQARKTADIRAQGEADELVEIQKPDFDQKSAAHFRALPRNSQKKHIEEIEKETVRKEEWVQEHQAGCTMWVNKVTGEVNLDCPFVPFNFTSDAITVSSDEELNVANMGTGALAYDSRYLEDLFALLEKEAH
jgi:hypothetical protein